MRVQYHISAPDRRLGGTEQGSLHRSADIPVCRVADFLLCFPKKRRQNSTSVSRMRCPTQRRHQIKSNKPIQARHKPLQAFTRQYKAPAKIAIQALFTSLRRVAPPQLGTGSQTSPARFPKERRLRSLLQPTGLTSSLPESDFQKHRRLHLPQPQQPSRVVKVRQASQKKVASSLDVKVSLRSQLSICVYLRKSAVKKLLLSFSFLFLFATQLKFKNPSILRKVPRR
jgi:hypothetical protein